MTPRERTDLPYIILLLVNAVLFFVLLGTRCSRVNPLRTTGGSPNARRTRSVNIVSIPYPLFFIRGDFCRAA